MTTASPSPGHDTATLEAPVGEAAAPRLVTVVDAARLLGVGRTTVYELIARGDLEVVHIGRAARIPVASIDSFVAELRSRRKKEPLASAPSGDCNSIGALADASARRTQPGGRE